MFIIYFLILYTKVSNFDILILIVYYIQARGIIMNIYNISKKEFKSLNKLEVNSVSTEAEIFIFDRHNKWYKKKNLFKKFYITSGESFSNKLYTINNLIDLKNYLNIPELVFPNSIISINHKIHGFSLPFVENSTTFYDVQKNINIPLEKK